MASSKDDRDTHLKDFRRSLYEVEGEERLQLWMEYTRYQDKDPDHHVSCEAHLSRGVQAVLTDSLDNLQDWMTGCLPSLDIHSWSTDNPQHPRVVFSYTVQPGNANRMGNMHGGCTATLFDFATTMPLCLINKPGFWFYLGVSRTLNVSYLKPIPIGEKILIECEIMSIGKTLCTVRGVMRRQSDGVVLATCEHGKYNTDPPAVDSRAKSKL